MTTLLLRDALSIPEQVHAADFVLQLATGVTTDAERTLADYVVTEGIAASVDEALALVQAALAGHTSKGAFIHGSFGAGKSHFMAVLHLLLTGSPVARALPGLQAVVAKRQGVLERRLLAVDYHLLGKESLEQALFSGYLSTVKRLHPDAPAPVLHRSEALLADAEVFRQRMGDDAFFGGLGGTDDGWGTQSAAWTREAYHDARSQDAGGADRQRLVRDLVEHYFSAQTTTGQWLEISEGLGALTEHAKSLGYDGVLLFLDELVLWLAQHLSDAAFIQREASKVTKLVETESRLALPLISFVARQRELKDFLSGGSTGAERVTLGDSLQFFEGRFDSVSLAAADLPEIVNKRLLAPVSSEAAAALAAAVARVQANSGAYRHLLEDEANSSGADFGKVYPFSPALVDAMVALSTLLQRERTALKIMSELLVRGRHELVVSDVIPVGDLFDVVVLGDSKPLTDDMQKLFQIAATFYREKVRPYLLNKHHLTEAEAREVSRNSPFAKEDRLLKTLLVAEIAPGATSLKNLTASKLAALNYGSVSAFVPGMEAMAVVTMAKNWASEFGEVTLGEGNDPVIGVTLSGIDYDAVLARVQIEDKPANRRRLLRDLLIAELGIADASGALTESTIGHVWRGQRQEADVIFGNVRDSSQLHDGIFQAEPGRWRVIIDFPFDDDATNGPNDDVARVQDLRGGGLDTTTIVWVPHFLTVAHQEALGTLVMLDFLLRGDHFDSHAVALPVADREPARRALSNRRDGLRDRLLIALRQAYGIETPTDEHIAARLAQATPFLSLAGGLELQTPGVTNLKDGLHGVLDQAYSWQYPNHPDVADGSREVRRSDLAQLLELARRATAGGGRLEGVERARVTALRRIVEGYGLGAFRDNVYTLEAGNFRWNDRFARWAGGGTEVTVADLREHLGEYGLTADAVELLILTWAALEDREILNYGSSLGEPTLGSLRSTAVLREPVLPSESDWQRARERAKALFGVGGDEHHLLTAGVARLSAALRDAARRQDGDARALVEVLQQRSPELGLDLEVPQARYATARRALDLLEVLTEASDDTARIEALAGFDLSIEAPVLARSLTTAGDVVAGLRGATWEVLGGVRGLTEDATLAERLRGAANRDELHERLRPVLAEVSAEATRILLRRRQDAAPAAAPSSAAPPAPVAVPGSAPAPPAPSPPPVRPPAGEVVAGRAGELEAVSSALAEAAASWPDGKRLRVTWRWE